MSNFLSCLSCLSSFSSICNLHFPPYRSSHLPATAASLPDYSAGPRVRCCLLDLDYTTDCKRETGRLVQPIFGLPRGVLQGGACSTRFCLNCQYHSRLEHPGLRHQLSHGLQLSTPVAQSDNLTRLQGAESDPVKV